MQKDNINKLAKGLHLDSSPGEQPQGTYRFALNAVNETELGDFPFLGNEESNEICDSLPTGYIPLGKIYIGNNNTVIFSVSSDELISEIGIMDDMCNYVTHVNDEDAEVKLNFKIANQIQATYRLRRGCERTVYFTDAINKPRYFNFDKAEDFQNCDVSGNNCIWNADKFSLFKTYTKIPVFEEIQILEGGNLTPGSYNASIQYLDEDLNPTEWIVTTETIIIYNDTTNRNYSEIRGSTNAKNSYQNFGATNKSIRFIFEPSSLDSNYLFYRIAIIKADDGSGEVSQVLYSQEISTDVTTYTFTGTAYTEGTQAEIQAFANPIETVGSIEQIENRLLLANTKGKDIDFCRLQKYASKIKADLVLEPIILNAIVENNPKNGLVHTQKMGYMPGEIYSFGIVYIFEDGYVSPVYHIPGRNSVVPAGMTFTIGDNIRPMALNNTCSDSFYTDSSNSCVSGDYWGYDSEGQPLINGPIRHHRFPLRSEINEPLVTETLLEQSTITTNVLKLKVSGTIDEGYPDEFIYLVVRYTANGIEEIREISINTTTYNPETEIFLDVAYSSANDFAYVSTTEVDELGNTLSSPTGLVYEAQPLEESTVDLEDKVYTTNIFGIRFSGIELPDLSSINNSKIIGYYIVRNERTEDDRTILDTGVFTPLMDHTIDDRNGFVAHGHLMPDLEDTSKIKADMVALIHPEFKFRNIEYKNVSEFIKEGEFRLKGNRSYSSVLYEDVMSGTSYDPETSKRRESDSDGFSLKLLTRDSYVSYHKLNPVVIESEDIKEIFYLDTLFSKTVTDVNDERRDVYNISGDNKIGIVQFNDENQFDSETISERLPYVVMRRSVLNPYYSFRTLPYYKESKNYHKFNPANTSESVSIFNGDSYVTPMRYHSAVFYDVKLRKRASKKGLWNTILGVISIIGGAVLAIVTLGGSSALSAMLISFGVSQIASGIKKDQMAKVYTELYEAGLRETVKDDATELTFGGNPLDDTIQWLGDTVTNLWFESNVNMSWRQGTTQNITDFLNAPSDKAVAGAYGISYYREPQNELDSYLLNKLTILDADNSDGRLYQGFASAEIYEVNKDYSRRDRQKIYYHLGLEYDCCSDCTESFPHRIHYSEQSFQEELTDNYRTFLPNNYRDIEGETGRITNVFKINNHLFIHTEEALYQMPKNYQERVTDQIVSFIGTGSYFEIPPQRLVDDDTGSSAGCQHKWSTIKTPHGVFFVSENQRKIYRFDGRQIKAISNIGMSNWFKENLPLRITRQHFESTGVPYPLDNNPSNLYGAGFISTYDSKKERLIFTKKDFLAPSSVYENGDIQLCFSGNNITIFENFNQIIEQEQADGWTFVGIEDCAMKFEKTVVTTETQIRQQIITVPNTAHIYVFRDTSGSFDTPGYLAGLQDAIEQWYLDFRPEDIGMTKLHILDNSTERWINFPATIVDNPEHGGKAVIISLVNEASPVYHNSSIANPVTLQPTGPYVEDYNEFLSIHPEFEFFAGITYPIATIGSGGDGDTYDNSRAFIQHTLLAIKGEPYTPAEIANIPINTVFTTDQWNNIKDTLLVNSYAGLGPSLETKGWTAKVDRNDNAVVEGEQDTIITPEQFALDINDILANITTTEFIEVEVNVYTTETKYIEGSSLEVDLNGNNTSWTLSFSLKNDSWTSWHSYTPSFYFNVPEKFSSWKHGNNNIYIHEGTPGSYQTFYGNFNPHIIEYVSASNPLVTRIWNHLRWNTEAKRFIPEYADYVEQRFVTFNQAIIYNSRQCTGLMNLTVKDTQMNQQDYFRNQVVNNNDGSFMIDRTEKDWYLNDLRDIRIDYNTPIWNLTSSSVQPEYYIDKVLNINSMNINKSWMELESFKDKYLVVRLIFNSFADTKLITNYTVENEQQSFS